MRWYLGKYTARIYAIRIVWMHNAPPPPSLSTLDHSDHFDGNFIKYTRHYKFISAILPELICSLGIAVINFIPADVSNRSFIDEAAAARPTRPRYTRTSSRARTHTGFILLSFVALFSYPHPSSAVDLTFFNLRKPSPIFSAWWQILREKNALSIGTVYIILCISI